MRNNVTEVYFNGQEMTAILVHWQHDYKQILKFADLDLPFAYEVDFANAGDTQSKTMIGNADGVEIPDEYLMTGKAINAYIYLHDASDSGETVRKVSIQVHGRPERTEEIPDQHQQSLIEQAIATLDAAVEQTASDVQTTGEYKEEAHGYADDAKTYAEQAEAAVEDVSEYATRAETAAEQAEGFASTASEKATEAGGYVTEAKGYSESASSFASDAQASADASYENARSSAQYASDASGYASSAYDSAQSASGSASDASSAKDGAVQAKADAISAKNDAVTAKNDAIQAKNDAVSAKNDAIQAKNDASGFATTASEKASEASGYADDAEASADRAEQAVENCPNIYGTYDGMTVGQAKQIVTDEGTEDSGVYLFRESGGGNREANTLIGGTVAWNQLWDETRIPSDSSIYSSSTYTENNVTFTKNGDGSITIQTTAEGASANAHVKIADASMIGQLTFRNLICGAYGGSASTYCIQHSSSNTYDAKFRDGLATGFNMWVHVYSGAIITTPVKIYPQIFNIDQMFGTTISSYLLTLGDTNGFAWFRKLFPKLVYPRNTGALQSVQTSEHRMVGKNQWNGTLGNNLYVEFPTIAGKTYTVSAKRIEAVGTYLYLQKNNGGSWANVGNVIANNTENAITFTAESGYTYALWSNSSYTNVKEVQIEFGSSATAYEPYSVHSYPLDSDLVLRGTLKLDAQNNLYYDGDVYRCDGSVQRRYGVYTFDGTETWTQQSATAYTWNGISTAVKKPSDNNTISTWTIISGLSAYTRNTISYGSVTGDYYALDTGGALFITKEVYDNLSTKLNGKTIQFELATPTTETADPFAQYQIVDADGTEEYVDERTVPIPVGHDTKYLTDVVQKILDVPDSPTTDGTYILEREDGENEYIPFDPSDYVTDSELTTALADKADKTELIDKADVITSTASGEIVTISDGGNDLPVVDLKVSLLPVQDLHGQDAPYPPGGGKNKINAPDITLQSAGYIYNGALSLPAGTYTMSFSGAVNSASFAIVDGDGNAMVSGSHVVPYTFTIPSDAVSARFYVASGGTYSNIQIESGSSATAYAPYSNVCPISGWTGVEVDQVGKNLLPTLTESGSQSGITWTANADGTCTVNGTATETMIIVAQLGVFKWDGVTPCWLSGCPQGGNYSNGYSLRIDSERGSSSFSKADVGSGIALEKHISASAIDNSKLKFCIVIRSGTVCNNLLFKPMLEFGTQKTDYEPYNGTTYPISWQSEAGTVYGGNIDLITGVLKVTYGILDLGTKSWSYNSTQKMFFTKIGTTQTRYLYKGVCSTYRYSTNTNLDKIWGNTAFLGSGYNLWIKDSSYNDSATFKSAMSGQMLAYELETPVEYQLSPTQIATFLGNNSFWSNGNGQIDLGYRCDTKLYIEQLTKPTEDDMTANQNITSGSFFMVGNRLFIASVAIGQGETIIPGTNCTEVSLADALNQINA